MKKRLQKLIESIEYRPWWFIVVAVLLTVVAVPGILRLETATGMETLVSSDAQVFQDTRRHNAEFGSEPVVVFLEGELEDIFSPTNLLILAELEDKIAENGRYHSILGPVTVLQLAIEEAALQQQAFEEEISRALELAVQKAMRAAALQGLGEEEQTALVEQAKLKVMHGFQPYMEEMAQMGEASLENPLFVNKVLYAENGDITPAMAGFIPAAGSTLITISPVGNLAYETSLEIVEEIESFFLSQPLEKVGVTVVADVEIVETIAVGIASNLTILLGLAVVVMALILLFIFQVRLRLLSLLLVGISVVWTFGLMGYLGVPLSMATMAVLPVLIGLGIDYAIQFHNRYQEELAGSESVAGAVIVSATKMFPAAGVALLATIIGFITLYISDVPMVRDFGVMLAVGVFLSYVTALFLLHSILYLTDRKIPLDRLKQAAGNHRLLERVLSRLARGVIKVPALVIIIALAFGIAGGIADQRLHGSTDFKELMPQDAVILQDLERLGESVGHGPSLRFLIEADDVTEPDFLHWLYNHQEKVLEGFPQLLSVNSVASLVSESFGGEIPPKQSQVEQILEDTPAVFTRQLVSADRKMTTLTFRGEHMVLEEVDNLFAEIDGKNTAPPAGVRKAAVGMVALGASTIDSIMGRRLALNLICLSAIFLVLLLVYRRFVNVVFTIISVGLVIAWSSLALYLAGIPLNPLTAILGVIVIGIGTEFMVLIISRYEEEKKKGQVPREAMVTAISKIGRAVVITALTTLGGFGVLIVSDFVLIRDFGIATVSGVFLCLVSSMLVMPPLLVFFDERVSK